MFKHLPTQPRSAPLLISLMIHIPAAIAYLHDRAWFWPLLIAIPVVIGGTMLGLRFVNLFRPSFAVLLFLIPVPGRFRQHIAIPLQEASAKVAHFFLDLFAVPVARAGSVLQINGREVAIAEACNGMRMVVALGLIAFAFVFSVPMRNSVRLLILACSPLVAVLVNVIRLVPTVLVYGYSDAATGDLFHELSGWAVLAVAVLILWGVLALLRWIEVPIDPFPVARQHRSA